MYWESRQYLIETFVTHVNNNLIEVQSEVIVLLLTSILIIKGNGVGFVQKRTDFKLAQQLSGD